MAKKYCFELRELLTFLKSVRNIKSLLQILNKLEMDDQYKNVVNAAIQELQESINIYNSSQKKGSK